MSSEKAMKGEVAAYLEKYPPEIRAMYVELRELICESLTDPEKKLWAKLPSYYVGESFIRLIPFKNHINIESSAILSHKEELADYKLTPKGMLQLRPDQPIPSDVLNKIFRETLKAL